MVNKIKPRQYKPTTIRRLDTMSGNRCAAPSCNNPLIAKDDGKSILSKICHIEAASSNGPRYNPNMSDDERRHFNNLILLCDACHIIIDNKENEQTCTVTVLKTWKKNHESIQEQKLSSNPSFLNIVVEAIINTDLDNLYKNGQEIDNSFNTIDKLEYNSIKRNRSLIEDYKIYNAKISSIYKELEDYSSFKKEKLFRKIRDIYLKTKDKYLQTNGDQISLLQKHADDIFEDIQEELFNLIKTDKHKHTEEIDFAVIILMTDAFMRCKILEEPK